MGSGGISSPIVDDDRRKKMNFEEIPEFTRHEYIKKCECCGLKQKILTQEDDRPEYYTEIYLQCQCGVYIEFELPVN